MPQVTQEMLLHFVAHCHYQLKLKYATIKAYLCGIRFMCLRPGNSNPWVEGQTCRLEAIVRAIKRLQGSPTPKRLPITFVILKEMCAKLESGVFTPYKDALLKAVCCVAFFAFLRCGEFTCERYDPTRHLTVNSVTFSEGSAVAHLFLKSSKTDPLRQGITISLHMLQTSHGCCPVRALIKYLRLRSASRASPTDTHDGVALDRRYFIHHLKHLLKACALNPELYNGHSFRIGAATTAAQAKVPDHLIQTLGRWSSSCYTRYIRTSQTSIKGAHNAMSLAYPS